MANAQMKIKKSILAGELYEVKPEFLHRMFENSLSKYSSAEKVAIIYEDEGVPKRETKYWELNMSANQMANAILRTIKTNSLTPNQDGDWIIAICMKPSDNLIRTLLAIWKAGAAYLPIDVAFPQNRIEHIMKEAKPVLVIYDDSYSNPSYFGTIKSIKHGDLKREANKMGTANIPDEQMLTKGNDNTKAVTLYTSGSTGMPKGVRLRHHTFLYRIIWQIKTYPFGETEKFCVFKTALTFVDHVAELWCPLFCGMTVIAVPKEVLKNPERFVPILEDYKIQRLLGVPTLLRGVLMYLNMLESNKTKFMLSNLKMWASSGETLTVQLAQEFFEYFETGNHFLLNLYGCTEINCDVCCYELRSKKDLASLLKVPLGKPLPNTVMYVLDNDMKPVDEGEVGEIYCAGINVTDGYINGREPGAFLKNPMEATAPLCNMYKTGDFGMAKNGLLYYEGRRDTQIKVRGHRIDVAEVEKNINELSYIQKSAILVYHAMQLDQALVAFIAINKPVKKTPAEVENDLKRRLADYMIPQVQIITEFPYLPNGKVDRQGLLKMYEEIVMREKSDVKLEMDFKNVPRDKLDMAKLVFEIVGNSIGNGLRNKVSLSANFFELGGNSLNSVYTVTQLRNKGFFISITDFLKAENLGEVMNKVSLASKSKDDDMLITSDMKLIAEPLNSSKQEECIQVLASSFYNKADLDKFLPNLKMEHYLEILGDMWSAAIKNGLSFMVKNDKGELVGVALNFDAVDEPEIKAPNNPLVATFDFLEFIEKPVVEKHLKASKGQIFHGMMMGTAENMSARHNIAVMAFMENENIKLATAKGFKGIFTTNTNPLTQQFGESVFGYETISDIYVNKFVDRNGHRPFAQAPETQKVVIMYKAVK